MKKQILRFLVGAVCVLLFAAQPALAADHEAAENPMIDFAPTGAAGTLCATISGVPEDVAFVTCTVWCNMSDLRDYPATKLEDGTWQAWVSGADHKFRAGNYRLAAWTSTQDGGRRILGSARTELQDAGAVLIAEPADDLPSRVALRLTDVRLSQSSPLWFRVSSVTDSSDFRAYFAYRQDDGSYTGTMVPSRHEFAGRYRIEACAGQTPVAFTEVVLPGCINGAVNVETTDADAGAFRITASAEAPSGVQGFTAVVWADPDQSDLASYEMQESGGTWSVETSAAEHGYRSGLYTIRVYAKLGSGLQDLAGEAVYECTPARQTHVEHPKEGEYVVTMLATGLTPGTTIQLPTWSTENGQDDVYQYSAPVDDAGNVHVTLDLTLHSASKPSFVTHFCHDDEYLGQLEYEVEDVRPLPSVTLRLNRARREVYDEVGRDLHDVYLWTVRTLKYVPRPWQGEAPKGYTREQKFALEGFETHQGDCFVYSAVFAELARGLGYDAEYVEGYVWSVRGLWADHGFVVIHQDGADYICDPELQSVSKTERNLFMQPSSNSKAKYKW